MGSFRKLDNTVRLWDCQTGQQLRSFLGHSDAVNSVAFSPDGKWALSGSGDKTVRLWDCQTGKQIYCLKLGYDVQRVRFLPDGKEILISTKQPALQRWQLFDDKGISALCLSGAQEVRLYLQKT